MFKIANWNLERPKFSVTEVDLSNEFLTKDSVKGKIRNNIIHICVSNSLLSQMISLKVGACNHFTDNGFLCLIITESISILKFKYLPAILNGYRFNKHF